MSDREKRLSPPPLNQIPAEDMERMQRDGLAGLVELDTDQTARLELLIHRVWETFYELIVQDEKQKISGFFVFDADESEGDFSQIGAICSAWNACSCIGLDYTVENTSDEVAALLLMHELAHAVMLQGEHNADFENFLNYLILVYNQKYNVCVKNDFDGFNGG